MANLDGKVDENPVRDFFETNSTVPDTKKENRKQNLHLLKRYSSMVKHFSLVLGFVLSISFAVLNIIIIKLVKNVIKADYAITSAQIVKEDSEKIGYWNDILVNDLRIYTDNDATKKGNVEEIVQWLVAHNSIRNAKFKYIMFCSTDGTGYTSEGKQIIVNDKAFFRSVIKRETSVYISNVEYLEDGTACYYIAVPAFDSQLKMVGVYAAVVDMNTLDSISNSIVMGETGYGFLVGSDGVILSHMWGIDKHISLAMSSSYGFSGLDALAEQIRCEKAGSGYFIDQYGKKMYATFSAIPNSNWTAVLVYPAKQIDDSGNKIRLPILLITIIIGVLVISIIVFILIAALKPMKAVRDSITDIANGDADLTKTLDIKSNNEIGELGAGFNLFMKKLWTIVKQVKGSKDNLAVVNEDLQQRIETNGESISGIIEDLGKIDRQVQTQAGAVDETSDAVEEISKNIESLEDMIETQSRAVSEASAAVEQMIGNINSVNSSVVHMVNSFGSLTQKTDEGILLQNNVDAQIQQIEQQSQTLQDANKVISAIASQTNLLAMNAAIEAAHAGDAGRGFSVVADEIRKLSENSSFQSKKIKDQLKEIQISIEKVVHTSQSSSKAFGEVNDNLNQTQQLVMQIQAAMEEQQQGSKQISDSLKQMNDNTSEVRQASVEMGQGNKHILEEVNELRTATSAIKESMDIISGSAREIRESSDSLNAISGAVKNSIDEIAEQIDLFKV